jgi:hypothetical protein
MVVLVMVECVPAEAVVSQGEIGVALEALVPTGNGYLQVVETPVDGGLRVICIGVAREPLDKLFGRCERFVSKGPGFRRQLGEGRPPAIGRGVCLLA